MACLKITTYDNAIIQDVLLQGEKPESHIIAYGIKFKIVKNFSKIF
jgi:hypothetical protein